MGVLTLKDSGMDVVIKMSEGNPGAINVIMGMLAKGDSIDPDSAMPGMLTLMMFDDMDIRGTDIYILCNDVCNKDLRMLFVLARACQLGFLPREKLVTAAKDQTRKQWFTEKEMAEFDRKVCEALPGFKRATEEALT